MNRTLFPIVLVVVLVVLTGWAVYQKVTDGTADVIESTSPSPTLSVNEDTDTNTTPTPGPVQNLEGGVQAQDLVVGDGEEVTTGMRATVHYTGWLTDGTKFDSSVDRGEPFQFRVGAGDVIRGWDVGVVGMKIGGVRNLVIPAEMGYGAQGAGGVIPPNATLLFQVQLLGVGN